VDADRDAVAALEQEARDRGVGLQLSREELLKSLAEINQELVQPLTVSSALLQMLKAGTAGTLSDAQRELVQTASEGMDRLERLIAYLQRISGFPVDISPDAGLLSEINSGR
jgi:signal transduction histidine kinase